MSIGYFFISSFVGNIIIFDSFIIAIVIGILSNTILGIHPAVALLIGIASFGLLNFLQRSKYGFWIIAPIMSLAWGAVFGILAFLFSDGDYIWMCVVGGLGIITVLGLHKKARDDMT